MAESGEHGTVEVDRRHTHVASSGKAELTLDQLAFLQPGLARLMLEIGNRFWRCYHAAAAQNRRLARYQLSEGTKLLRMCAVVRPQYREDVERFVDEEVARLREAVEAAEWEAFEVAFAEMTETVNRLHDKWNHGYLVWQVPKEPPQDLVLEPRPEDR